MPDPTPPLGVDYYPSDDEFVGGVEVPPFMPIDWASQVENGVRFAYLKLRQGSWEYAGWFDVNWRAAKDAGLLRGPYLFLHPCEVVMPAILKTANWSTAALAGDIFDNALAQVNAFCDRISLSRPRPRSDGDEIETRGAERRWSRTHSQAHGGSSSARGYGEPELRSPPDRAHRGEGERHPHRRSGIELTFRQQKRPLATGAVFSHYRPTWLRRRASNPRPGG